MTQEWVAAWHAQRWEEVYDAQAAAFYIPLPSTRLYM